MTTFMIPFGLLRIMTLLQRVTNLVAQFIRIIMNILQEHIPKKCQPFLDDIRVLGLHSTYNNIEDLPGIRKFIQIYIQ